MTALFLLLAIWTLSNGSGGRRAGEGRPHLIATDAEATPLQPCFALRHGAADGLSWLQLRMFCFKGNSHNDGYRTETAANKSREDKSALTGVLLVSLASWLPVGAVTAAGHSDARLQSMLRADRDLSNQFPREPTVASTRPSRPPSPINRRSRCRNSVIKKSRP